MGGTAAEGSTGVAAPVRRRSAAVPAAPRRRAAPARPRRAAAVPEPRPGLLPALGLGGEAGLELATHEAQDARVLLVLDELLAR